ncbi:flagellar biosynthesis protein FliQ [Aliidongia dinghuensis]|uniref:Flagellar biosynthetic protein FliQ n=1 Tax=Aliidongia dinghuensis TaxID=1867774 RepID=A0A8J2YZF5_9PROT|nr:flagellar biosynthesis protein FliQ [Aliidongia dinghuensis]GGF37141.1 flagellar biosynthesis protein FliQ [Aliidongia dinghuensis]
MNETEIIDVAREAIFAALKIAGGPMLAALVVGIAISVFQALTQIQEQTLTFVPKIIVIFLSVLLLMPFMLGTLETFARSLADRIIAIQ